MNSYAPLGIGWMDFHAERMLNALEFLILNGAETYGFTIWSTCADCVLESSWSEGVTNHHLVVFWPYLLMYYFGGEESLLFLGPLFDKFLILTCAILTAELILQFSKSFSYLPDYLIGVASFSLFSLAPWTYKMLLSGWWEAYFLVFFIWNLCISKQKK